MRTCYKLFTSFLLSIKTDHGPTLKFILKNKSASRK
jgi:hypothetical protein